MGRDLLEEVQHFGPCCGSGEALLRARMGGVVLLVVVTGWAALHEGTGWQLQPGGVSTFVHVDGGQKLLGHDPFWALVALVLCRQQFGNVEGGNQKAGDHRSRGLL